MVKKKELSIREMAAMGGKARAKTLNKKRLSEIGKQGAAARWPKCTECDSPVYRLGYRQYVCKANKNHKLDLPWAKKGKQS